MNVAANRYQHTTPPPPMQRPRLVFRGQYPTTEKLRTSPQKLSTRPISMSCHVENMAHAALFTKERRPYVQTHHTHAHARTRAHPPPPHTHTHTSLQTHSPRRETCVSVYACVMLMQCLRCTHASLISISHTVRESSNQISHTHM